MQFNTNVSIMWMRILAEEILRDSLSLALEKEFAQMVVEYMDLKKCGNGMGVLANKLYSDEQIREKSKVLAKAILFLEKKENQ